MLLCCSQPKKNQKTILHARNQYKTEQARALKLGDYRAMKEREKPQYPKPSALVLLCCSCIDAEYTNHMLLIGHDEGLARYILVSLTFYFLFSCQYLLYIYITTEMLEDLRH